MLAAAGGGGFIYVWDVNSWRRKYTIKAGGSISGLAFGPRGETLASVTVGGRIAMWDLVHRRQLWTHVYRPGLWTTAISPDGGRVAAGSENGRTLLWRSDGHLISRRRHHDQATLDVAFSPNGRILASAGEANTIVLEDVRHGDREAGRLRRHTGAIYGLAFSPDGRRLASSSFDRSVIVWDLTARRAALTLRGHTSLVYGVAFARDERLLASAAGDGNVILWDTRSTLPGGAPFEGRVQAAGVAYSPDGRFVVAKRHPPSWADVPVWNVATGRVVGALPEPRSRAISRGRGAVRIAFSANGRIVAGAGIGGVTLWDARTRHLLPRPATGRGRVNDVAFDASGRLLAVAGEDGSVKLWDALVHRVLPSRRPPGQPLNAVALSPDGRRVAWAGDDGNVGLWDRRTGKLAKLIVHGPIPRVWSLAFSPDGRTLASGGDTGSVLLWNVAARPHLRRALNGHRLKVWTVAFSPDGRTLASTSSDGTLRLWDVRTGHSLGSPIPLGGPDGSGVAFRSDGRALVTGSSTGVVQWNSELWSDGRSLVRHICAVVARPLHHSEWREFLPSVPYRPACRNDPATSGG